MHACDSSLKYIIINKKKKNRKIILIFIVLWSINLIKIIWLIKNLDMGLTYFVNFEVSFDKIIINWYNY